MQKNEFTAGPWGLDIKKGVFASELVKLQNFDGFLGRSDLVDCFDARFRRGLDCFQRI